MKNIMHHSKFIIAATALLFAACDKIQSEDYTVYDGASISWTASNLTLDTVQRAYVEKYTGPNCSNCPDADATLNTAHHQFGDSLIIVTINHRSGSQSEPYPGDEDMRTDGGNACDEHYGINAIPAAFINRNTDKHYLGAMPSIITDINTLLQQKPSVAIQVSAIHHTSVDITVDINLLQNFSSKLTLTALITEDSLVYKQNNHNVTVDDYVHNHMLRKVITGFWGREIDCAGTAGEKLRGTLSFSPSPSIKLANSHIVVFVSDKNTRRVLNAASCRITNP